MVSIVREVENGIRKNIFNIDLFKRNIYFAHSEAAVAAVIFAALVTPNFEQLIGFAWVTAGILLLKIKVDFNYP